MKARNVHNILLAAAVIISLALLPAFAFAQGNTDDEGREAYAGSDQEVQLQDMTVTDDAYAHEESGDVEVEVRDEDRSEERSEERTEQRDTRDPHWAATIGSNAAWGGIAGGLIGLGAWLVTGMDWSPWTIAQFAGGGILVGTAIGVVELTMRTERDYAMEQPTSLQWMERDMPNTYDIRLFNVDF